MSIDAATRGVVDFIAHGAASRGAERKRAFAACLRSQRRKEAIDQHTASRSASAFGCLARVQNVLKRFCFTRVFLCPCIVHVRNHVKVYCS